MAWIKVPPEHHPIFHAALPRERGVITQPLFGGVAAKVNGNVFAGLFARSVMVLLSDADREAALALDGAGLFDPMGDGRARSDKVMLPEDFMEDTAQLAAWIRRAYVHVAALPPKAMKKPVAAKATTAATGKKPAAAKAAAKKPARAKVTRPVKATAKKAVRGRSGRT